MAKAPWFVVERSESLAALLLTNQQDVNVVSRERTDDGADLLVGLDGHASPQTRIFAVQVKGTVSVDETDWIRTTKALFHVGGRRRLYLPTCVFVVNVRDNTTRFAWIAEPVASSDRATLTFHGAPAFHELDDAAVTEIVRQVKAYYDALPKQLLTTG